MLKKLEFLFKHEEDSIFAPIFYLNRTWMELKEEG